ncbi:SMC-Scp complex subunit ScpB [Parvularcula sp. IMCC14364]|uniref:SMC-Scp complex subunit ScpB n=1 Tax=Parvularcula sp. IMCC14364 TaxID=3067902 RepID=UPI0027405218|nr:SMC-Scp complex subunit ScpB [Parvularcula sp. IMCC14364]
MSHDKAEAANFSDLDAQEAQAALAEALEAEIEQADATDDADVESRGSEVVSLSRNPEGADAEDDGIELFVGDENPFAAAAEFARQVRMVEALLFAASEPLDEATLKQRLPEDSDVKETLNALQEQYQNRGVNLLKTGKKWQFVTAPDVSHVLEIEQVKPKKLSRAALETLAIIAYHQPCTRADIEEVRGVAVSKGSLDQLLEIGWIRLRGRREDTPGRPTLYGTSQEFLEHFGLQSITHLPGMADLKAQGLLDARLPPGFVVPTPKDSDAVDDENAAPAEQDFVQDFHEDQESDDAEEVDIDDLIEGTDDDAALFAPEDAVPFVEDETLKSEDE